ncbi:MAG: hypothetical protein ACK475_08240 [Bacteroidota bacterium]|jgi:hypothetical protein
MNSLVSNLGDFQGEVLIATVLDDLKRHVIGQENAFFGAEFDTSLLDRLHVDTSNFHRAIHLGLEVWEELDRQSRENLILLASSCHDVLYKVDSKNFTERYAPNFVETLENQYAAIREQYYKPVLSVIGGIRYVRTAGLYDEAPATTQARLDELFANYQKRTLAYTDEQISKLRVALQEVVSGNITTSTVAEINRALCWMRVKALLTAVLSAVIAWCTISFVLGSQDSNLESTYHVAASIARRLTVVTISLFAVGLFVRLLRSYISTIEGLQHKRRLLESSGELLVMGGAENSQYVFTQLITILMKNDFAMTSGDKTDSHEASVIANVLSNLQKSESKT